MQKPTAIDLFKITFWRSALTMAKSQSILSIHLDKMACLLLSEVSRELLSIVDLHSCTPALSFPICRINLKFCEVKLKFRAYVVAESYTQIYTTFEPCDLWERKVPMNLRNFHTMSDVELQITVVSRNVFYRTDWEWVFSRVSSVVQLGFEQKGSAFVVSL